MNNDEQWISFPEMVKELSPKELEVVQILIKGMTNKQIASQLNNQVSTILKHLERIYEKLKVNNRTELTYKWLKEYELLQKPNEINLV